MVDSIGYPATAEAFRLRGNSVRSNRCSIAVISRKKTF
jgi:hypothetical protein